LSYTQNSIELTGFYNQTALALVYVLDQTEKLRHKVYMENKFTKFVHK